MAGPDLAILTADFLTVPEDQIMNITAYMTIVDGKVVYDAQSLDAPSTLGKRPPPK